MTTVHYLGGKQATQLARSAAMRYAFSREDFRFVSRQQESSFSEVHVVLIRGALPETSKRPINAESQSSAVLPRLHLYAYITSLR
jgi:hypothetical protein